MLLNTTLIILAVFVIIFLTIAGIDIYKSKTSKKNQIRYNKKLSISAYLMLLPAVVLAFLFIMLPILFSLGYAFTDYYLLDPNNTKFIFLENFKSIFNEVKYKGELFYAIKNTAVFVVCVVPLQIGLALGLALFCNRKVPGAGIFKVCFFAPVVISLTVTSYLWLQILSPSETGLLNSFLGLFGKEPQDFLRDPNTAILWIVVLSAWQGCGFQMLIFLSALTNIREDLYEAAALDGANTFNKFLYVTVPSLKPTFLYVVITVFIGACRIMVQPMLMVGYQNHVVTISYYMYQQGYSYRWVGLSSSVALIMTIVIGTITLLQRKFLGEKE
jgi:fructooligosaccharide transport system permease protein